jgi:hypothetical protein
VWSGSGGFSPRLAEAVFLPVLSSALAIGDR